MLEVRKVRVGDVGLRQTRRVDDQPTADRPRDRQWGDGILLKAEAQDGARDAHPDQMTDWASVHMNLEVKDGPTVGKELLLALLDRPKTEEFMSAYGSNYGPCRVNLPEDSVFSFTVVGHEDVPVEVKFQGNQAQVFVRALLYHWFVYKEETPVMPAKTFVVNDAATYKGVSEVKVEDGDPDDQFID